jgi:hypothetical protein
MTPEEIVQIIYPDFYASASLDGYVTIASGLNSADFFGDQWGLAVALMASHNYYLDVVRRGQAGVETYKMEGRLAASTGGVGVLRDNLDLTSYGMRYKALRQGRMAGVSISSSAIISLYGG